MSAREDLDACTSRMTCPADAHVTGCPMNPKSRATGDLLGQLQSAVDRARADRRADCAAQGTADVEALAEVLGDIRVAGARQEDWWTDDKEHTLLIRVLRAECIPWAEGLLASDWLARVKAEGAREVLAAVEVEWFNGNLAEDAADRIRAAAQAVTHV